MLPTAIGPLTVVVSVWHNFTAGGKLANTQTQARNRPESHSCVFWPHSNMHACTQTYMAAVLFVHTKHSTAHTHAQTATQMKIHSQIKAGSSHLGIAVVKDFIGWESETLSVWAVCDDQFILASFQPVSLPPSLSLFFCLFSPLPNSYLLLPPHHRTHF